MEKPSVSGIYQIRHIASGKVYVGSAQSLPRRKIEHWRDLRRGSHGNAKLQRAWNKYGEGAFLFEVLERVDVVNALLEREQVWIDRLKVCDHGYNIAPKAGSLLGHRMTAETRERMSKARRGKKLTPEHVANTREALLGRKMTLEQRQKMRDAKLGTKRGPHSEATRKKMSVAAAGRVFSDEHRAKLALAKTGKPWSEARRAASNSTA